MAHEVTLPTLFFNEPNPTCFRYLVSGCPSMHLNKLPMLVSGVGSGRSVNCATTMNYYFSFQPSRLPAPKQSRQKAKKDGSKMWPRVAPRRSGLGRERERLVDNFSISFIEAVTVGKFHETNLGVNLTRSCEESCCQQDL